MSTIKMVIEWRHWMAPLLFGIICGVLSFFIMALFPSCPECATGNFSFLQFATVCWWLVFTVLCCVFSIGGVIELMDSSRKGSKCRT